MKVSRRRMTSRFLSMLASAVLMMGSVAVRASDATPEPAPSPVGCAVWRTGPVDAADLPPECTYSELWRNRWNDCDVIPVLAELFAHEWNNVQGRCII